MLAKSFKMAATEATGLTFVDEDDLPVAFLHVAQVDSDNETPPDVDSSVAKESANESGEESNDDECGYSNLIWSSLIITHKTKTSIKRLV